MCVLHCAVRTVTHSDNKSILAARQRFRVMNEIKSTEKAYVVGMQKCMQVSKQARMHSCTYSHSKQFHTHKESLTDNRWSCIRIHPLTIDINAYARQL